MNRAVFASAALLCVSFAPFAQAQGPLERIGQGLDRAGKNIRRTVEENVATANAVAQENTVLVRVSERIKWDKRLAGTTLRLTVSADNSVILQGTAPTEAAKARAIDLVENTVGVTTVTSEIAVAKNAKVIKPTDVPEPVVIEPVVPRPVIVKPVVPRPVVVEPPVREEVIIKP